MPVELTNAIDNMATTTLDVMSDVVTSYWPLILGLIVLVAIGIRLKRALGVAK